MNRPDFRMRDGFARAGSTGLNGRNISLPGIIDPLLEFPNTQEICHENIPLSGKTGYDDQITARTPGFPVPVHPADTRPVGEDGILIVPNWHTVLGDPQRYVRMLYQLKAVYPPYTVWYAPACALPSNLHILCYSGFDLFDWTAVDLCTAKRQYCLPEGVFSIDLMDEGLCGCPGCRDGDLAAHNREALRRECALVRYTIGQQQIRDLVESRSRLSPAQVSIFRLMDQEYTVLEQTIPVARKGLIRFASGDSIARTEIRRFMGRVVGRYVPPRDDVAVILPCSAKKPYSLSQSHQKFIRAVGRRAHEIIVTSPLGLVPRDLELCYPAGHYDVPVTGYWDYEERHIIASQITDYFTRNPYRRIIIHLDGDALDVACAGIEAAGLEYECTATGAKPTDPQALDMLYGTLDNERKKSPHVLRGMCSWQFGLIPDTSGIIMEGRYPGVRFMKKKRPWFGIDTETGMVRPTFDGWSLIPEGYRVYIDSFDPKGDILAPGIRDADPAIREGDEVLVIGDGVAATGRASMGASEMMKSRRGVAVRVRKVKRENAVS